MKLWFAERTLYIGGRGDSYWICGETIPAETVIWLFEEPQAVLLPAPTISAIPSILPLARFIIMAGIG